jgi:hypothetical protein
MTDGRTWSWRHAVLKSALPPTTRHVLLTISCFMNDVGGGCYPTQEQLAEASGLSARAVRKHIDDAVAAGWLVKREHGFRGQKWRNHEYEAAWPTQDADQRNQHVDEGEEPRSARISEAAEPGSGKVRNDVPTILPDHHSKSSLRSDERARPSFDELWDVFPRRRLTNRKDAEKAFAELSDDEAARCLIAAKRFAQWHIEDSQTRNATPESQVEYRTGLGKWIRSGAWVAALSVPLKSDPVPPGPYGLVVLERGHPDIEAVSRLRKRPVFIGDSGKVTLRIEEVEQARGLR